MIVAPLDERLKACNHVQTGMTAKVSRAKRFHESRKRLLSALRQPSKKVREKLVRCVWTEGAPPIRAVLLIQEKQPGQKARKQARSRRSMTAKCLLPWRRTDARQATRWPPHGRSFAPRLTPSPRVTGLVRHCLAITRLWLKALFSISLCPRKLTAFTGHIHKYGLRILLPVGYGFLQLRQNAPVR
jgi:hypothetical protein